MGTHWPKPGLNHVGEYQVSGHTFVVTGSANITYLKYVASSITATSKHDSSNNTITFYDSGHSACAFTMKDGASMRFTGKFLTFKVAQNCDALVEITNIQSSSYNPPSGSQIHRLV